MFILLFAEDVVLLFCDTGIGFQNQLNVLSKTAEALNLTVNL